MRFASNGLPTDRVPNRRRLPNRLRFLEDQKAQGESRALERFQTRDWKAGDIYAPHDLSPAEMKKWGKRKSPARDAFDALNLNPLSLYKVCSLDIIDLSDAALRQSSNIISSFSLYGREDLRWNDR